MSLFRWLLFISSIAPCFFISQNGYSQTCLFQNCPFSNGSYQKCSFRLLMFSVCLFQLTLFGFVSFLGTSPTFHVTGSPDIMFLRKFFQIIKKILLKKQNIVRWFVIFLVCCLFVMFILVGWKHSISDQESRCFNITCSSITGHKESCSNWQITNKAAALVVLKIF